MSSFSHRSATAPASLPMLSPSVRSSGRDRRAAAGGVNPFFDFLERGRRAGDEDHMSAGCRQRFGRRRADAPAGAGDERKAPEKDLDSVIAPPVAA